MGKEHIVALVILNVLDVRNILPLMGLPALTLQTASVCLHSRVISQLVKNAKGLTICGMCSESLICVRKLDLCALICYWKTLTSPTKSVCLPSGAMSQLVKNAKGLTICGMCSESLICVF